MISLTSGITLMFAQSVANYGLDFLGVFALYVFALYDPCRHTDRDGRKVLSQAEANYSNTFL
jgi:hypothetical protein